MVSSHVPPIDPDIVPIPRWLWWNILSLDAPAVAVAWALLFAHASSVRVPPGNLAVLALAVWLIYVTDRLLDGWRIVDSRVLRARHRFYQRHPRVILVMAGFALASGAWLIRVDLTAAELKEGLLLAGIVAAYMLCIHLLSNRGSNRGGAHRSGKALSGFLPKEIAVGFLFAAGTALPVWSQRALTRGMLITWLLFGLLCTLNCVAIEYWENNHWQNDAIERTSETAVWLPAVADSRIGQLATGLASFAWVAHALFRADGMALAAIGSAALLILLLNLSREWLSAHALRVLADVALLIPAILALAIRR